MIRNLMHFAVTRAATTRDACGVSDSEIKIQNSLEIEKHRDTTRCLFKV